METLCFLIVSEVSTNKINICSNYSIIFLSSMDNSPQLYSHSPSTALEYTIYGQGNYTLICFHGFGQSYQEFQHLSSLLPTHRILSINLLFHGRSHRSSDSKYLTHKEWKEILNGLLDYLKISTFSVIGYSMGGRYTTSTIHSFSNRIDHCFLVAPDGIVKRSTYEFATFPLGSEQLFRFFMENPKTFFTFLNLIEKTKLFNQWTINFSRSQLRDEEQRKRVYKSWIALRKFRLPQAKLVELINTASFQTTLIFGKYDNIIQPKRHLHFFNKLKKPKVIILDTGHSKLLHESFSKVSRLLNRQN